MSEPATQLPDDRTLSPTVLRRLAETIRPDPLLTVSEWADAHRILPPVGSAKPGAWVTARTPYLRLIMDCLSPSAPYELVVLMAGGQIGKSEAGLNWMGYIIDQAPGPMLAVQPTVQMAERFSRQRVEAMIAATGRLRRKVAPPRKRDSGNTILAKEFPNGILVLTGANSAASLRAMPARYLFVDEVDAYPPDVEGEGDPIELARVRTETYVRSKTFMSSTPTIEGLSRIELALGQCDRRYEYRVACPHCGHRQVLVFDRLRWPAGKPREAAYCCAGCEQLIPHRHKPAMVRDGEWVLTRDVGDLSVGFHMNQLYSMLGKTTWGAIAEKYEKAKDKPALLRVFINTVLGLPFVEAHEAPDWHRLYDRRESYEIGVVPHGVLFLTAGVDVQKDRVEAEIVGWGRGKESWSVDYRVLMGDPTRPEVWEELAAVLATDWPRAEGGTLPIRVMGVDSGYATDAVCAWVRRHPQAAWGPAGAAARAPRTVTATKGFDRWLTVLQSPQKASGAESSKKRGLRFAIIGASLAKRELYEWLRLTPPSAEEWAAGKRYPPGYCHFPQYAEGYFRQLTAERLVTRMTRHGFPKQVWEKDPGAANECLDARVIARAAAAIYGIDRFTERQWTQLGAGLPGAPAPPPPPSTPPSTPEGAAPTSPAAAPAGPKPPARPERLLLTPAWNRRGRFQRPW